MVPLKKTKELQRILMNCRKYIVKFGCSGTCTWNFIVSVYKMIQMATSFSHCSGLTEALS